MTVEPSILFPPFHLDPVNAQLWRGTQALELRPKSFAVLQYLLEHSGQLVTKEELLNAVWPGTYVSEALVKDSILEIRKVLGDDPRAPQFIETVHRRGYRFIAAVQNAESEVHSQEEMKDWKPEIDSVSSPASSLQPPASNLKERYWRRGTVALIVLLLLGIMGGGIKSLFFHFSLPATAVPSEQAREMAQQAIALDNSLPSLHQLLSYISLWNKQYEQAIAEAEQAIALDPNAADGYVNLANILAFTGRPKESIGLIEKAMRLNPRAPAWYLLSLGFAYRVAGRYEEAITLLKRVLTLDPEHVPAHFSLAICYAELGQQEEAQAEAAAVLKLNPQYSLEVWKQKLPFKDPAVLERQLAALRKAGLK